MPNNRLLATNQTENKIELYDQYLNHLKTVDNFDGETFNPYGVALNDKNEIYISDRLNNRILMIDLDFKKIKSIGSKGYGKNEFRNPAGICFKNNKLYICDDDNRRIEIYSENLEYIESLRLCYRPQFIKASDSTLCIQAAYSGGLNFHCLNGLASKNTYFKDSSRISMIDSCFYQYRCSNQTVLCFDDNGSFTKEIIVAGIDSYTLRGYDGFLLKLNDNLLMSSNDKKLLIKFSK